MNNFFIIRIIFYIPLLVCLSLFTSCVKGYITVKTSYLSHENLASYHVGTPDPMLYNPPIGQQLTVSWIMPKKFLYQYHPLQLKLTIRLRNHKQIVEYHNIEKAVDSWVYLIMNNDYFDSGGIQTYKVELLADQELLDIWVHQLWTELINFPQCLPKD